MNFILEIASFYLEHLTDEEKDQLLDAKTILCDVCNDQIFTRDT